MPIGTTVLSNNQRQGTLPRVLVVDDEPGPRESLRLILKPHYDVMMARNGQEALRKLVLWHPDMIISDIRMPSMDGIQLLREVKERAPDTPFILLTGYGSLESAQEAVRKGAFDYISKPYDVNYIQRVVAKAFEETRRRREMDQALGHLETTNEELERNIQDLDQKAALGELSAEMIHDLNNPICALQGYVELLECTLAEQPGFPESEEREFLDVIKQQATRCIMLTRRFLDYARSKDEDWIFTDVSEMIQDTLFVFKVRFRSSNIRVQTEFEEPLPRTWFLRMPVQQALYNLITNAVHAMEEQGTGGGNLVISTRSCRSADKDNWRGVVEIGIRDTGPGVPRHLQNRIFKRFFSTKPKGKGTGLGLSICKRVMEQHGGGLTLRPVDGPGACFVLTIPVREQHPDSGFNEEHA